VVCSDVIGLDVDGADEGSGVGGGGGCFARSRGLLIELFRLARTRRRITIIRV
jgi:hypothetical protein